MTPETLVNLGLFVIGIIGLAIRDRKEYARQAAHEARADEKIETLTAKIGVIEHKIGQIEQRTSEPTTARDLINLRSVLGDDIKIALAQFGEQQLTKFNGRYPSKEVFIAKIEGISEQIGETRKYIGDVKRDLGERIDRVSEER